ncbi:MAG: hydroxymethylglutaryl-CoA lyase [Clostridia bacterium]|nr:hydroxymethylglutaryl-CoA lyase [Clostridia bacterium]NCC76252.1 hydroxymethylglutaryl-CoA lyase [Clostridia bacterium]
MSKLEIYEVGPRDGFQNIPEYIPLETKLAIIEGLIAAGIRHLQFTSFVSPKAVPQMKDAVELSRLCLDRYPDLDLLALVPNLRGAKTAWETGIRHVSTVISLSESHNRANINRTHAESQAELAMMLESLPGLDVCLDLATAFGCPFEGAKTEVDVVSFIKPYVDLGIRTVNLCDTIGIANPAQVRRTIAAIRQDYPRLDLMIHIHDTRNMGMVNTLAAIEAGVDKVQSTVGGLGGCPFAPGASGNLATEDLVFMLQEMGYDLDVDVQKLIDLARDQARIIPGGIYSGHLFRVEDPKNEHRNS